MTAGSNRYTPQVTTNRSFEAQEREIFQAFLPDYGQEGADAIAKSSTAFTLRYMTEDEVFNCLVKAGIAELSAHAIVVAFAEARAKAEVDRMLRSRHDALGDSIRSGAGRQ